MTPADFLTAARVPKSVEPQTFGLWEIERRETWQAVEIDGLPIGPAQRAAYDFLAKRMGDKFPDYTLLRRHTDATVHLLRGEIVMEDSEAELRKHLPIWMHARGRVLVTGLGLGCVVRGLLINPAVTHIDVVEIDKLICNVIGPEFQNDPRVTIHLADALQWQFGDRTWDYAWHDLHSFDETNLQLMHAELFTRFMDACPLACQGAWAWPRWLNRRLGCRLLGAPKVRYA